MCASLETALSSWGPLWYIYKKEALRAIEKMLFSAKCIFDRIGAMKFFEKKKLDAGFDFFHIF